MYLFVLKVVNTMYNEHPVYAEYIYIFICLWKCNFPCEPSCSYIGRLVGGFLGQGRQEEQPSVGVPTPPPLVREGIATFLAVLLEHLI